MLTSYLKLLRIPHWIKNFFVFVPIIFSKHLFQTEYFISVLTAFFTFSFASSMIYVFNDLLDIEYDKKHPIKKERPLPSGKISKAAAVSVIIILALITLILSINLNRNFCYILLGYIVLNVFYSIKLKDIVIVDIFSISAGFMLRVLAGAFVINIVVSSWLILTTLFISLFLSVMKRKSELMAYSAENNTRNVLKEYSHNFIDQISAVTAGGVIISYALYSVSDRTAKLFNSEYIVFTAIFVVFGIFRYMFLVYRKSRGENPTEIMLTDFPMVLNMLLYIFVLILIIYLK